MRPFVLVVDMIHDFVYGKFKNERAIKIIPNIKKLLDIAREKKIPIIYLKDSHEKGDPEESLWGEHALKDTKGSEIIDELKPKSDDYIILKRTYSGFFKTDLDLLLKKLETDTAFVVGISTDICVQNNVGELFYRGFTTFVLKDCTASISEENHESALNYMKNIFNAKIISLDEALKLLEEVK
ncbi:MAG: isochorismatase family cysteine hydrolase [Caldisericia bacterium]|nr:isochorismatase family cysteine hydrolase [Caldisericia bacterium]